MVLAPDSHSAVLLSAPACAYARLLSAKEPNAVAAEVQGRHDVLKVSKQGERMITVHARVLSKARLC
jgi:hypothetical protein